MSTSTAMQIEEQLRYPTGRFQPATAYSARQRAANVEAIEDLPACIRAAVHALDDAALDTPYRHGGWTVRQLVHHIADSHMNSYLRFRWTLTEDTPLVKTYDEKVWAELADARTAPVEVSLQLLDALHLRWALLLRSLSDMQWRRCYRHPELGEFPLDRALALYAWHGRHHAAQVTTLRERMGW